MIAYQTQCSLQRVIDRLASGAWADHLGRSFSAESEIDLPGVTAGVG
jgi:hypothetical protein